MSEPRKNRVSLDSYKNNWYQPGGLFRRTLWLITNAVFFNHGLAVFNGFKIGLLRLFGARIGKGVLIKPSVSIKYPWFLIIGDHCWIGEKVWIDNLAQVTIGNHVCLSQGALLLTGNHDYSSVSFDLIIKPIVIGDGVWVGARAIVAPGTTIHEHTVVTAGSVAVNELESFSVYRGNPAQRIKSREIGPKQKIEFKSNIQ